MISVISIMIAVISRMHYASLSKIIVSTTDITYLNDVVFPSWVLFY